LLGVVLAAGVAVAGEAPGPVPADGVGSAPVGVPAPGPPGTVVDTLPGAGTPVPPAPAGPPVRANPPQWLSNLPLVGRLFPQPEGAATDELRVDPHYELKIEAPEPLVKPIRERTLLGRWRTRPDYDPGQLPLFIRRLPGEVRELAATEGWFDVDVEVVPKPGVVSITVQAGPRTTVARVDLSLTGEVTGPEHDAVRQRVQRDWPLPEGSFFRSADWERAKRGLLGGLRDRGFLRSRIEESEAIVDLERAAATLLVDVESGPRLAFGDLRIEGLDRYPAEVVEGLRPFQPGDPFDAAVLAEYQLRLNGAGWFTSVNVQPDAPALEADPDTDRVPIRVSVTEQRSKRWTLGAGIDTERGLYGSVGWENRNVFGRGIQTFNGAEIDITRQLLFSTWETPQGLDGWRWQFGARAEHRDIENDIVDALSVFASRNRRRGTAELALSLQYQYERQSIVFEPGADNLFINRALVAGAAWTQRRLDSPIFPSRGYIVTAQMSGASEAIASERSFVRAYLFGYGLVPIEDGAGREIGRVVLRGEIGNVFAGGLDGIPSANLFRTGGARSIRGYSSQSLGVPIGQAVVGGRFLLVGSVEYQHPIDRDLSLAVFYDRGNASASYDTYSSVAGYGVGVRWRTPVGPLSFDLAWGEAVGDWRLHFSVGVVF
jgi:translocation and assembly module TamA